MVSYNGIHFIFKNATKYAPISFSAETASSSTSNPPENVDSPEDNAYEQVDPTAVYEKVDLQSNASYGKVHR